MSRGRTGSQEPGDGLRSSFDLEFVEDIGEVILHGLVAQIQFEGNFLVGFSFGQQRHDETFLGG